MEEAGSTSTPVGAQTPGRPEVGAARASRLGGFVAHPRKAVWTLALPMMGAFTIHAVYNVVDTAFVGRLGADALAALTYVGALVFLAIALTNGLSAGVTAAVAQAVGRGDPEAADAAASAGLAIGSLVGLLLMVVGLAAGQRVIPALGARADSALLAWHYFQPISAAMPLFFATASLRAMLTGEGDARTPMLVIGVSTLINLGFDPLLIFVLGWGIRGAAAATVLAQLTSCVLLALALGRRSRAFVHLRWRLLIPSAAVLRTVMGVAVPAAVGQLVMAAGMVLNNRLLSGFGQLSVAGYGAGSRVDLLVALPILGLAGGAMSVIGMFAGAGRIDLVRSTVRYAYRSVVVVALCFGLTAYLGAAWVVRLFTDDPISFHVGKTYLAYMVFAYPLMAFGITSGRILQGLGYGLPTLVITVVRVLLIGTGGGYLAILLFGGPIESLWLSMIGGGVAANVLSYLWVRQRVFIDDPTVRARPA